MEIKRLTKHHDRKSFDCGDKILNEFLKKHAHQHAERGISRTFVLTDKGNPKKILGYYTLTLCDVIPDSRLKRHSIPAVKLARLAVCFHNQGNGIGEQLLLNAMERSVAISENAGVVGLFVDAKNDAAAGYYIKYGFIPTENDPLVLFLTMASIRQSFG